ncbi:T9SS type A sorting domain-containing protein [Psychroserpens jangbogonensis]|uniref:T9SS type A sorting domain-containing protein n=1 Tax=Psychroserpens jangbogonensis TaxID=1484460 RepID=UPI00053D558F|nr:T9SS type A sorting domain-containing protein [Psychroserpens jangbogonensis]
MEGETLSTGSYTSSKLKIYPNPVSDIVTVEHTKPIQQLKLINSIGQVVLSKSFPDDVTSAKIDVSNAQLGHYILVISTTDYVYYQKLIIN